MLTGLLAALASTIDTHLNWGASYWSNDVYKRLICNHWLSREPKNHELVLAARVSNIAIIIIALIIMANLGSIQTTWFLSLLFGAGMGSVLVMRWLWERINLYSELAAMVVSLILAPILLIATNAGWIMDAEWVRLSLMAICSTVAAVAVTYFTPRTDENILIAFYRQVKPVGFWRKTATLADDNPMQPQKDFIKEIKTTFLTALSLFLMLLGTGKLLIRPLGESSLFAWGCIIIALVLTRFWWKNAIGEQKAVIS
jgi:Na+/proline symporter